MKECKFPAALTSLALWTKNCSENERSMNRLEATKNKIEFPPLSHHPPPPRYMNRRQRNNFGNRPNPVGEAGDNASYPL